SKIDDTHVRNLDKSVFFNENEEDESGEVGSDCFEFGRFGEEVKSEFSFGFGFGFDQIEDELISYKSLTDVKTGETEYTEDLLMMNTNKYEFARVKDLNRFVAEPESVNFTVHELFVDEGLMEDDDVIIKEKGISKILDENEVEKDVEFSEESGIICSLDEKEVKFKDENRDLNESSNIYCVEEVSFSQMDQRLDFSDQGSSNFEEKVKESGLGDLGCDEVEELKELPEKGEVNLGESKVLEPEKVNWLGEFFTRDNSFCYGVDSFQENEYEAFDHHFLSDDSRDGFISISPQNVESVTERESERLVPPVLEEIDDDYIELEPKLKKDEQNFVSNGKIETDMCLEDLMEPENEPIIGAEDEDEDKFKVKSWEFELDSCLEDSMEPENEPIVGAEDEEVCEVLSWDFDSDEEDVLLEHQQLIGQMKMELKNTRTGGLPTILEECETPRVKEDLKPLKIDEKLEHRDLMAEIQKFYKSYNDKMKKLDVLNYQTLQAINFLRMKHPEQINTGENASLSAIKSVLLPSLWPCKLRKIYADPTLKSVTELHKDLEIVYVGQACLSWEILHWQYKKAKELQLYDPQGYRSYNQIAIEFQQFHVLLRRFTEDELFQGPRVHNYTKQRCTLKGLLQVPAIKDDSLKEKKARKEDDGDAVSISTMAKTIKESMTVFWDFLYTDKDTTNLFLTIILQGSKAHLQDPADSELFMDIKAIHQKKEKRLKDMLRTGNCIVKKFQKQQETVLDQHMFVSQVELRLVSRVLSLPRLTRDQLLWCQSKLNNIKFIDRKIQVEDSLFLLFPC
ncbi:putative ribosomal protein L34Ae, partial [Tanacetum coccineum]